MGNCTCCKVTILRDHTLNLTPDLSCIVYKLFMCSQWIRPSRCISHWYIVKMRIVIQYIVVITYLREIVSRYERTCLNYFISIMRNDILIKWNNYRHSIKQWWFQKDISLFILIVKTLDFDHSWFCKHMIYSKPYQHKEYIPKHVKLIHIKF